jgi:hypothetical protein
MGRTIRTGAATHFISQPDSVSALDGANTGTKADLYDRRDKTAQAAAVSQR